MSVFVWQQGATCDFPNSDTWVILSPIEQSIKRKIELVGTPLRDWDIDIYRGVLTGCNEAFIISTAKREEILNNCKSEDERNRTAELIRPILRGRDIRRYAYEWQGLYLINTHNGLYKKLQRIDINKYPAVKHWLDVGGLAYNGKIYHGYEQLAERQDQGDTPYNLRSCKYLEEFSKPKIIYPNMTMFMPFYYDTEKFITNQKCFIITGNHLAYLTAFFNSALFKFCFRDNFPMLGAKGRELSKIFFDKIPILQVSDEVNKYFVRAVEDIQIAYSPIKATTIDNMIFDLYDLTLEERDSVSQVGTL